jgi:hypothetical protein
VPVWVLVGAAAVPLAACRDSGAGVVRATDAGADGPPVVTDGGPRDVDSCPADGPGGGLCPINFCGLLKSVAALGYGGTGTSGADSLCNQGRACVATTPAPSGDALQLTCVAPAAGAVAYGMPCATGAASTARCADDSLCIEAPDAPGAPFCSALCRVDADCAAGSYCLEYRSAPLPAGSYALVGMCTPRAKIAAPSCASEADCPAGQGCVRAGDRSGLMVCKPGGTKSLGEACAAAADCRSGECYDRDFGTNVGPNRTFCSGVCARNSDCGSDQLCVRVVIANNGTPDEPLDDVVVGYCRALYAPNSGVACHADPDCVQRGQGGDTCDTTYGICYRQAAVIGGACASDDGCGLGQVCQTGPRYAGGACLMDGCDPAATSGRDACPGATATCGQRASDAPLHRCYEGCTRTADCSRNASDGYFCTVAVTGQTAASICLSP